MFCKICNSDKCCLWKNKIKCKIHIRLKARLKAKKYHFKYPYMSILNGARARCVNPNIKDFKNYGGRGIKCVLTKEQIKELWFKDKAFLMKKPSIDRIDNDKNYEISNCRFMEMSENSKKGKTKNSIYLNRSFMNFVCLN